MMTDPEIYMFWMAFIGLSVSFLAAAGLMADARVKSQRAARIARACGTAPAPEARRGGPLHERIGRALLRMAAQSGERVSAILGGEARATAEDLQAAGFRGRDAVLIYAFLKTLLPLGTVLVGAAWVLTTGRAGLGLLVPLATVLAIALAISKGVDIAVDVIRKKRLARIRLGVADLLELLVITSEAGLGPQPALHRVAGELEAAHPELAREALQMVAEMRMTNDRRAAYQALAARVPLPEIGVFTQTLDQSDTYGTPFSRAMRTLMVELRSDRLIRVEEKAARLPVIMTVPLIFCIMPAVFIVLVGPAVLSILDNIIAGG